MEAPRLLAALGRRKKGGSNGGGERLRSGRKCWKGEREKMHWVARLAVDARGLAGGARREHTQPGLSWVLGSMQRARRTRSLGNELDLTTAPLCRNSWKSETVKNPHTHTHSPKIHSSRILKMAIMSSLWAEVPGNTFTFCTSTNGSFIVQIGMSKYKFTKQAHMKTCSHSLLSSLYTVHEH